MTRRSDALRSATRESVLYRCLLILLALMCLVSYWQLDLALQTLRAVSTPQGSTSFLAKNMRLRVRDVTLLTTSSSSSATTTTTTTATSATVGNRVVLDAVSGIAKPFRDMALPSSVASSSSSATATRECDSGTRFAFAPGTLSLWCVGRPDTNVDSHAVNLVRADGGDFFSLTSVPPNTSSAASKTRPGIATSTMSISGSGGSPFVAPFRPGVAPNPNSVEIIDVAEIAATSSSSVTVALVLLREKVFGSLFSVTCDNSGSSSSWSCSTSGVEALVDGNTTNFVSGGCTLRVLPSSSLTSSSASVVATCNDNNQTAAVFVASLSRTTRAMTSTWQQLSLSSLAQQQQGVLVHVSPVVSVPSTFPAVSASASSYVHTLLASFVQTSGADVGPSVALLDITAAASSPGSEKMTLIAGSATALTESLCPARAFNGAQDLDSDTVSASDSSTSAGHNCSCCHGWVVDPNVRSAPASLADPAQERFINGGGSVAQKAAATATVEFISFLLLSTSPERSGSLLHINTTFKNFHLASASGRSAKLQVSRVATAATGGPVQRGFGTDSASSLTTLSWNHQQQKQQQREVTSAVSTGYGPSFLVAVSPALGNATAVLALHNGTSLLSPILLSFVSHLTCPSKDKGFTTAAALGVFVNSSKGSDSDISVDERLSHYLQNSVSLACRTEQADDTTNPAGAPPSTDADKIAWRDANSAVSIVAADGGSWNVDVSSQHLIKTTSSQNTQNNNNIQVSPSTVHTSLEGTQITVVRDDFLV